MHGFLVDGNVNTLIGTLRLYTSLAAGLGHNLLNLATKYALSTVVH